MKIKFKILLGFLTLAFILAISAAYSIIEFSRITSSVSSIIDDNYKTINAANGMLEALERTDNGILLLQMGDFVVGRRNIRQGDSSFVAEYNIAVNNLTEPNEGEYLERINREYKMLEEITSHPIAGTSKEGDLKWYKTQFYPVFISLKSSVRDLLEINQHSMHQEAIVLKEKSKRAMMPGIVTVLASIVFTLIFSTLISYYYLSPLQEIIRKVNEQTSSDGYKLNEQAIDELKELDESLKDLISRVRFR